MTASGLVGMRRVLNPIGAFLCSLLWAMTSPAVAGEGHDHGEASAPTNANGPQRLPDGGVFLPKAAQRQLVVRTQPMTEGEHPKAIELSGRVVMDPNAGGKVQALLAGRLEPGPGGLPSLGQQVRKGEVLAYVIPSGGQIERSNQNAQLAELRAARALAEKRVQRLRSLADSVPRKELEAAESELSSLAARAAALDVGLTGRDTLVSPVAGVVSTSHAVAGQVVEPRELLYEVVDTSRLRIEALSYDLGLASNIAGASVAVGSEAIRLRMIGASRSLREHALPILFGAEGGGVGALAIGQAVSITVQTRGRVTGVRLAREALMRNPANQTIVWVKAAPERFEPRVVQTEPLDGAHVAVTSGLHTGDRVVVRGASLINQIR